MFDRVSLNLTAVSEHKPIFLYNSALPIVLTFSDLYLCKWWSHCLLGATRNLREVNSCKRLLICQVVVHKTTNETSTVCMLRVCVRARERVIKMKESKHQFLCDFLKKLSPHVFLILQQRECHKNTSL